MNEWCQESNTVSEVALEHMKKRVERWGTISKADKVGEIGPQFLGGWRWLRRKGDQVSL